MPPEAADLCFAYDYRRDREELQTARADRQEMGGAIVAVQTPASDRVAENVQIRGLARPRCLRTSCVSLAPLGPRMERERTLIGQLRQDPSLVGVYTVTFAL